MSDEQLTNSEVYVRKTNRIILIVGLTSLLIFLFGISLLLLSGGEVEETSMNFENTDDGINIDHKDALSTNIEIGSIIEGEVPLTMTPDPVPLGQVIIGSDARNEFYTFGYYYYIQVLGEAGVARYPVASAAGLLFTIVTVPVTLGARWIMNKVCPSVDY